MKITDEQRAAAQWAQKVLSGRLNLSESGHLENLLSMIPEEAKGPPLPKDPGYYFGEYGTMWMLQANGYWFKFGDMKERVELDDVAPYMPLVRAVRSPEPVQFTRDELQKVYNDTPYGKGFQAITDYINKKTQGLA